MSQLQRMLQETIAALTILDADALAGLHSEVEALVNTQLSPDEDLVTAMLAHRILGRLLQETERNLRLFRIPLPRVQQSAEMAIYGVLQESSTGAGRG